MHSVTEMHVKAGIPVRQFHGKVCGKTELKTRLLLLQPMSY